MADVVLRSAMELATAIRRRALGSRELLEHFLLRIERLNSPLNAVVTLDAERARAAADAADAAVARGGELPPLHGVPMTIKDSFETAGIRTVCGHQPLAEHVPAGDAVSVARLKAAGAIVFGKTNVPTLAGDLQTYNPVFGTTSNPWNPERTCGGSSGGAAVAVAMGFTGLELGSDIGGSIRTPCNWCGVYGHKTTHGLVPARGHIPGPPGTLADADLGVFGPIGRSADDLALALDVLAGPPPDRAVAWRLELPPPRRAALRDYRIAAWLDDPAAPVDAAVRERLEAVVSALRHAGCQVDERARPAIDLAGMVRTYLQLLIPIIMSGYPREEFERMAEAAAGLAPDDESPLARTMRFGTLRHRDWLAAHEARERVRARVADFFREWDVLLCPTTVAPAIPHDQLIPLPLRTIAVNGRPVSYHQLFSWIALATMAWLPATVAPVGRTPDGLPVGLQIVGPYLEDRTPIDVARRMADVIGGYEPPPDAVA